MKMNLLLPFDDKCIKFFWNSNNYSNITSINTIETYYGFQLMCLLEDDILYIGGNNSKRFYLIKISTHQLIKNILRLKTICSIIECLDGLFYVQLLMKMTTIHL